MAYMKINNNVVKETMEVKKLHRKEDLEARKIKYREEISKIDEMLDVLK